MYPEIFAKTPKGDLYCCLCNKLVCADKNFNIQAHLKTKSHLSKQPTRNREIFCKPESKLTAQEFLETNGETKKLAHSILDAFMSADIPLYKLRNSKLQLLFKLSWSFYSFRDHY